ncbi:MAG: hypothetical protein ACLRSW_10490 [Christensenellaceae bacterium]
MSDEKIIGAVNGTVVAAPRDATITVRVKTARAKSFRHLDASVFRPGYRSGI